MSARRLAVLTAAVAALASVSLADAALTGAGLAAAGGSAVFAGLMLSANDGAPRVNGIEYLAIFSQPSRSQKSIVATAPPTPPTLDMNPTGSIDPPETGPWSLVSAERDRVWLRRGARIVAARQGDRLAGLGLVAAIARQADGGWLPLGEDGAPLFAASPAPPFARSLIFAPAR